ncbi:MAG: heavy-metal-associated domain-containing protein [Acetobacteraceae bacterium]
MPVFRVPDMTCSGCVRAVTGAIQDIDSAAKVDADLESKQVRVTSTAAPDALAEAMRDAGFTVEAAA